MRLRNKLLGLVFTLAGAIGAAPASASLSEFQTFIGNVGYSSDGFGSTSQSGIISASVPAGSTVLAAYMYTSMYSNSSGVGAGGTLNGTTISYGSAVAQASSCCGLSMKRADVTSIVKPVIDGGAGGIYDFNVTETSSSQDGEALVVVYSNESLPDATFAIADGYSLTSADSFSINFADPLDPTDSSFFAEMFLGIGFSCCSQRSNVTVNDTLITQNAGNNDDGNQVANGSLITVGGFDDPYSSLLPSYADDHERYDLVDYISSGDTSIQIDTQNPSGDDNVFLAGFYVLGEAGFNAPPPNTPPNASIPEPGALLLMSFGMFGITVVRRRRNI